jgi:hypothetical protein
MSDEIPLDEAVQVLDDSSLIDDAEQPIVEEVVSDKPAPSAVKARQTVEELYSEPVGSNTSETVDLPSRSNSDLLDILAGLNDESIPETEEVRKWSEILESGIQKEAMRGVYKKALESVQNDFRQFVEYKGKKYSPNTPLFADAGVPTSYKGDRGVTRVMAYLGRGMLCQVPLWHTGIWLTLKAPSESEIIELHRLMISDKIEYGRATYGVALSNSTSYTTDRLVDFVLDHVYASTLKLDDEKDPPLKDIILSQDIYSLLSGLMGSIYPNGFRYRRACISDPEKCNYILEESLKISKLLWVNNKAFTETQLSHMSDRQNKCKTLESINRYKEEMRSTTGKTITVMSESGKPLKFTLFSPTVSEYISAGYRWIDNITTMIEQSVTIPKTIEEKNSYIRTHSQATGMRQYSHWVKEIEFDDGNNITDRDTIESLFDVLSSDSILYKNFIDEVLDYITWSTVAIVGIPTFTCPCCDAPQQTLEKKTPYSSSIIPLDVYQVFTSLVLGRIEKIVERQ